MARVLSFLLSSLVTVWLSSRSIEAEVTWPAGTYGLPKAKNGCPVSLKTSWTTGWRFEDLEDTRPATSKSKSYHLDTKVGIDVNRTFCIKNKNDVSTEWPQGRYCIFKKGDCPKGFKEGSVFWDDENDKNINKKGGTLPDGVYDKDTLVYYCCRTDGDRYTSISLPVISPFYLKTFNTSECQRVEGAIATEEFIRFETEDTRNKDRQNGSYPHGAGIANHRLLYCYYESCQFTYSLNGIRDEQIEFTSPKFYDDGYPLSQKCTWRFAAPEKKEVHIEFLEVDIENGDVISIHTTWKSDAPTWRIDKTPPKVKSYGGARFLLMEFQSRKPDSSRKKSKGFRGVFTVKIGGDLPPSGVEWPAGTFGIPRPRLGCPRSKNVTWSTGWRFQDTEDENPNNSHSPNFHMNSSVMPNDVNRTFCTATENNGTKSWPKGQYCIYKRGTCPKGLTEGYIFFDDENRKNLNKMGGVLPDGEYNEDTKLFYCCRTDGDKLEPISLPISSPFYLLAYNNSECQQVNGALATKEFIRFDDEDTGNKDTKGGTYPYAHGSLNISYCYYEACHFTISETSQEFMSPSYATGGYPNSQLCTWRFLVQESSPPNKQQVLIKFPEFNLQKGKDGDVVKIYSGWNEKAPLLAEFSGDSPPPAKGVASNSPIVFLVFRSDSRGKSKGFRGLFINQSYDAKAVPKNPITLPSTLTIKPTNQSLNVSTIPTPTPTPVSGSLETQTGSSAAPINVIIPVLITLILVIALVIVCFIRRKRLERRVRKRLGNSEANLVNDDSSAQYHDLHSQDYDSSEELQNIFPTS